MMVFTLLATDVYTVLLAQDMHNWCVSSWAAAPPSVRCWTSIAITMQDGAKQHKKKEVA
jgi:hypothetical protein